MPNHKSGQTRRGAAKSALTRDDLGSPKAMTGIQYNNGRDMPADDYPFAERMRIGWPVMLGVLSIVGGILLSLLANHWLLVPAKQIDVDQLSGRVAGIEHKIDKVGADLQELVIAKRVAEALNAVSATGAPPPPPARKVIKTAPAPQRPWALFGK